MPTHPLVRDGLRLVKMDEAAHVRIATTFTVGAFARLSDLGLIDAVDISS